jgi:hypothetical protein
MRARPRDYAAVLAVSYGASVLFNLLVGSYSWLPGHGWELIFLPVPESLGVVLLVLGISRIHAPRRFRPLLIVLSFIILIIFLFNLGQTFFRYVYRRDFDPYTLLPLVPEFFAMVFRSDVVKRPSFIAAVSLVAGALLGGFFFLLLSLLRRIFSRFEIGPAGFLFPAALLFVVLFLPSPILSEVLFRKMVNGPADFADTVPTPLDDTGAEWGEDKGAVKESEPVGLETPPETGPEYAFPGIEDPDIYLFVAESYGHTIFTNPHHFERLEETYRDLDRKLNEAGFRVYTTIYESTTFGGTSWLADTTLITGIEIDTQAKFNTVIDAASRNLIHILGEEGYTTVFSAPGTKAIPEPQKRFYSFSRFVLAEDFGYQGPYFTFGDMPDQFQINHVHSKVLSRIESPFFVEFMLVSSHVPWNYIPPVIEEWRRLDDGSIYYDRSKNTWYDNSWAVGSELFEGYTHSIRYVLKVIVDYLITYLSENELIILVGDHQPKFPISEEDAGFGVPVHIISRNKEALKHFARFGYAEGFIPPEDEGFYGLESFLGHFLYIARGRSLGRAPGRRPDRIPPSPFEVNTAPDRGE